MTKCLLRMKVDKAQHSNNYQRLFTHLAAQALAWAETARPIIKCKRYVKIGLSAAHLLLDDGAEHHESFASGFEELLEAKNFFSKSGAARYDDYLGHSRPVYHPLLIHLHLQAYAMRRHSLGPKVAQRCAPGAIAGHWLVQRYAQGQFPKEQTSLALWMALCALQAQQLCGTPGKPAPMVRRIVNAILNTPGPGGSLHPFDSQHDLLDTWTYHELSGLHALGHLARLGDEPGWDQRVQEIAMYHLEHTQPDHVTAQPWAVFVFASLEKTTSFADQQLHDTQSYWQTAGNGAALVPAMLLADGACAMGRDCDILLPANLPGEQ